MTIFTTPSGKPASSTSLPNSNIAAEACSDAFKTTVLPAAIALTGAAGATGAGILDLTYPDSGFNVKDIAMMAGAGGAIVYPVELCLFAGLLPALAKLAKKTLPTAGVFAANASIAGALGHTLLGATGVTLGATVAAAALGGLTVGTIIGASLELSSDK